MSQSQVWIVQLHHRDRLNGDKRDTKYVRAATTEGAERTARANSWLPRSAEVYTRLATPQDLGCTRVERVKEDA